VSGQRKHEYTRQRQGRDFSLQEYLARATSASYEKAVNLQKAYEDRKTLTDRLEAYITAAENGACKGASNQETAPIDGHEPPERGGI